MKAFSTSYDLAQRLLMKAVGKYEIGKIAENDGVYGGYAAPEIGEARAVIEAIETDDAKEQNPGYKQILDAIANWREGEVNENRNV